jgi:putative ABC transport system permease protein
MCLYVETFGVADAKHLFPVFKQELSGQPGISGLASADNGLGEHEGTGFTDFSYQGKSINTKQFHIDPDYIPTLGMHLLAGRNFDRAIASDTVNAVIINESMMHQLGWKPENCIGRQLEGYGKGFKNPTVIGVVRDFNYEPLLIVCNRRCFISLPEAGKAPIFFMCACSQAILQKLWLRYIPHGKKLRPITR